MLFIEYTFVFNSGKDSVVSLTSYIMYCLDMNYKFDPLAFTSSFVFLDTSKEHQQQQDAERQQRVNAEHVLGAEFDRLHAEIEKKDRALLDLLRLHDEQLKKAQQDSAQNSTVIEFFNESKQALLQLLKQGQGELKTSKEDKQIYKSALAVIVKNESIVKKTFLRKIATLQRKIALESSKVSALEQTFEHKSNEYEEVIESMTRLQDSVIQEKALLEQGMTEMIKDNTKLRKQIEQVQMAEENRRSHFDAKEQALKAQHSAKIVEMSKQIACMNDEIQQLHGSLQLASAPTQLVSCLYIFNNVFTFRIISVVQSVSHKPHLLPNFTFCIFSISLIIVIDNGVDN